MSSAADEKAAASGARQTTASLKLSSRHEKRSEISGHPASITAISPRLSKMRTSLSSMTSARCGELNIDEAHDNTPMCVRGVGSFASSRVLAFYVNDVQVLKPDRKAD